MRRQLRSQLPLLMATYPGVKPWDLDRFTRGELMLLLEAARTVNDGG